MSEAISVDAQNQLFFKARSYNGWLDKDVDEALIKAAYDLMRWAPTSGNGCPARFVFLRSKAAKERLAPFLMESNVEKTLSAPWTVIVANDHKFADKMDKLFPHDPGLKELFSLPDLAHPNAERNGTLQGAYFMMAVRAVGLDCGPMSGFDQAGVDKEFFEGAQQTENWKSNFLINVGHGDKNSIFERNPRLDFEEACQIL